MFYINDKGVLKLLPKELVVKRQPSDQKVAVLTLANGGSQVCIKVIDQSDIVIFHGGRLKRAAMYEATIIKQNFMIWDQSTNDKTIVWWLESISGG